MREVAVFPLPDMVAFPGQTVPLHIFEPRYRKMLADCLEEGLPLALACATEQISNRLTTRQSTDEMLSSNQESYRASAVVCVGDVTVKERLPDGRLIIDLVMTERARIQSKLQSVPYGRALVKPLVTSGMDEPEAYHQLDRLKDLIAILLGDQYESFQLQVEDLARGNLEHLISQYIHTIRVDSSLQQGLLEVDYLPDRIRDFADIVEAYLSRMGTDFVDGDRDSIEFTEDDFDSEDHPVITPKASPGKPADEAPQAEVIPLFGRSPAPRPRSR